MVIGDIEVRIGQDAGEGLIPDGYIGPGLIYFPGMETRKTKEDHKKEKGQKGVDTFHNEFYDIFFKKAKKYCKSRHCIVF
jgi:hypothetical protein